MLKHNTFFFNPIELLLIVVLFIVLICFGYRTFFDEREYVTEFFFTPTICEQPFKECVELFPTFLDDQMPKPIRVVRAIE